MESATMQGNVDLEKLERQREEALRELEHLRLDLRNLAEPTADDGDIDAYEREKIWALAQSVQRKLDSIEQAIALAHNGTYGLCQSCGDRIDPARLEILPTTTLCLRCRRDFERRNKRM